MNGTTATGYSADAFDRDRVNDAARTPAATHFEDPALPTREPAPGMPLYRSHDASRSPKSEPEVESTPKVFRSHDREREQQSAANADLAQAMKQSLDRMEQFTDKMERVVAQAMSRPDAPAAVMSSPTTPERGSEQDLYFNEKIAEALAHGKLHREVLPNGDHSYSPAVANPLDHIGNAFALREAFIERHPTLDGRPWHVEVTSTSDRAIEAAMLHVRQKLGPDEAIRIHVSIKHPEVAERLVRHAVRRDIAIETSGNVYLQQLVAEERERQRNPLVRDRSDFDREFTPLIEVTKVKREQATGRER